MSNGKTSKHQHLTGIESPSGSYSRTEMDGEVPTKPRKQKGDNQNACWKMLLFLMLCLLQAANALTGPRQVSGEPGGAVTIQCHYTPSSINRHQRKYWCRLRPLTWICHTIVSSNKHIHHRYHGRVALTDFPQRGLFVVRLSQLSLDDVGRYRCGIGDNNYMLSFSMNLTISAGPFNHSTTPVARELITGSFATASPATNTWTPGTTQMTDGQGMEWGEVASTLGTSKTTASTQGGQTPEVTRSIATGPGTWIEGPIRATVPIPEHPASKTGIMSNMTEGAWAWGTRSSETNRAGVHEGRREMTSTEAVRPTEGTERVRIALDAAIEGTERVRIAPDAATEGTERVRIALDLATEAAGTIKPSVSQKLAWETLQEATPISKQRALESTEGMTPTAGVWPLETSGVKTASAEGRTEGDLGTAAAGSDPRATPSQNPATGPRRPLDKESSVKSASPEEENMTRVLPPVFTVLVLFVLVALALLQRKLQRKRTPHEIRRVTLLRMTCFLDPDRQPGQLPQVERKMFQDGSPPTQASMTVIERDSGP
ncbi:high affinity immunoglobulin alpha and immunoglobulin mu Fc receptor [Tupaia chinensis]|uniref:high affinity immunoglobulin alpha and immunoglobulin mu Fc receptor n=1 Tax=Tupaia chinensis TaxID=246437 RepID=UPI000703FC91|nr:high affinity immunoglobulin alpha and immunoglobulin mu Fc receptor [Tupaia chinensis]